MEACTRGVRARNVWWVNRVWRFISRVNPEVHARAKNFPEFFRCQTLGGGGLDEKFLKDIPQFCRFSSVVESTATNESVRRFELLFLTLHQIALKSTVV